MEKKKTTRPPGIGGRAESPTAEQKKVFKSHNAIQLVGQVTEARYSNMYGVDVCEAIIKTIVRFQRLNGTLKTQSSYIHLHMWQNHLDVPVWKIREGNILSVQGEYKNTVVHRRFDTVKLVGVFVSKVEILAEDGELTFEDANFEYDKAKHLD